MDTFSHLACLSVSLASAACMPAVFSVQQKSVISLIVFQRAGVL